jgi:accessory colonization factor AcfC
MPTISVKPSSGQHLQAIADALGKSKRVVVITGAGISTNCGIPVSQVQV